MRELDALTQSLLTDRRGIITARLIWIEARNTATQAIEALGLWSGEGDLSIDIDGVTRNYVGAGELLDLEPVTAGPGLDVRVHQIRLSAVSDQVETLVKGYDTRGARVELHRAIYDPATLALAGAPHRLILGVINGIDFPRGAPGEQAACVVEVVSETRALSFGSPAKKSDEDQRRRGDDRFRRYGDISGSVPVYWGERYEAPASSSTASSGGDLG